MPYKKPDMQQSIEGRNTLPKDGVPFWTPPSGGKKYKTTWIRILPIAEDDPRTEFYCLVPLHYGVGPNNRIIVCRNLITEGAERCPQCERGRALYKAGQEEAARECRATWRALVNMIAIDEDGAVSDDGQIQVWAMSKDTYLDLLDEIEKLPEDERDITDPETGRDVYVDRKGTNRNDTRYKIGFSSSGSAPFLGADLLEEDDALHNLSTVHESYDADTVEKMLKAASEGPDPFAELPEGDEVPPTRRLKAGRTPAVKDEEEENEEEEEEEEEEKPKTRQKASRAAPAKTRNSKDAGEARERLRKITRQDKPEEEED